MAGACASLRLLVANKEAAKAILAVGLLTIVNNVPSTLVINGLQSVYWGERMAEYQGWVNLFMYGIAFFATGPLGRFGDRYGNVSAVAAIAAVVSLPSLAVLVAGPTALGLTLWAIARVVTGLTGSSFSGSPAYFSLINELSAPDEVETLLGLGFAGVSLFWMTGGVVGLLVMKAASGSDRAVLFFVVGVSVMSLLVLATIQGPRGRKAAEATEDIESAKRGGALDVADCNSQGTGAALHAPAGPQPSGQPQGTARQQRRNPCAEAVASFRFACKDRSLGSLCGVAALVSIPETVLFDVNFQFAYSALGFLGGEGSHDQGRDPRHAERVLVAYVSATATQVALLIGCYAAGVLAKRFSSRRLMLWLIPVAAFLQCLPTLLIFLPHLWAVGVVGAVLGSSLMVLPPLQAMVAQVAPPGRASEAMGAVGAFKCLASLLGNLLVSLIVPVLQRSGLGHPLWVLYPACGAMTLSAVLLVQRLPAVAAHGATAGGGDFGEKVPRSPSVVTATDSTRSPEDEAEAMGGPVGA